MSYRIVKSLLMKIPGKMSFWVHVEIVYIKILNTLIYNERNYRDTY